MLNNSDNIDSMDKEQLISFVKKLEKKLKNIETEKQLLDAERLRLEQEVHSLRNEIDRLREPPLVGGIIIDRSIEKDKYIVKTSTGPFFVVNASKKIEKEKLEPRTIVELNQRTFAIMGILPITLEQIQSVNQIFFGDIFKQKEEKFIEKNLNKEKISEMVLIKAEDGKITIEKLKSEK